MLSAVSVRRLASTGCRRERVAVRMTADLASMIGTAS